MGMLSVEGMEGMEKVRSEDRVVSWDEVILYFKY